MIALAAVAVVALSWMLLLRDVSPVPTWFYVCAWYPTLVIMDWAARRRDHGESLFRRPLRVVSLFGWSAAIWLVFEAANFRLQNWYYVFLPANQVERWAGILISFATVVPAVVLAERLLAAHGIGRGWRSSAHPVARGELTGATLLGCTIALLALGWPKWFFPLIWGAGWLIAEPLVYRRRPEWSLFADIERGEWGRLGRLLGGGLGIGLLWEFYNFWARGRWIYTVPWLEHTKLFEMPPLGFLGFPVFALEAWAMYHAACAIGVAVPPTAPAATPVHAPRRIVLAVPAAVLFAVLTLSGMEHRTISSVVPALMDLAGVPGGDLRAMRAAGYDSPFAVARSDDAEIAGRAGITAEAAARIIASARVVTLRGIGSEYAGLLQQVAIRSVCDLAHRSPTLLWIDLRRQQLRGIGERDRRPNRPKLAEVRVWVGSAGRVCPSQTGTMRPRADE